MSRSQFERKICETEGQYGAGCPSRKIIDEVADKWSMMLICVLSKQSRQFCELGRRLEGVTPRALTLVLRRLERNGLIERRVIPDSPVRVEYSITELGRSLKTPFEAMYAWSVEHADAIEQARSTYDARNLNVHGGSEEA